MPDMPHLLFYGPSGAGKKTRITCLLREIFGPGVEKLKAVTRTVKTSSKTVEIATVQSNWHVEITPSDAGSRDLQVVQEVIKEIAMTPSVSASVRSMASGESKAQDSMSAGGGAGGVPPFKVVVLHDVDRLSLDAQHGLRRTMEQYTQSCRLILCCESACRVAAPLRSRTLMIRIPAPSTESVVRVLNRIAENESLELPLPFATRLSELTQGNLRRAILALEAAKVDQYPFAPNQKLHIPEWEKFIADLATLICEEQSPARLLLARGKVYELLTNCIPADIILRKLTECLLARVDDELRHKVVRWAAYYDHRMALGSKPVFHIEAFIAKFMAMYRNWLINAFGG